MVAELGCVWRWWVWGNSFFGVVITKSSIGAKQAILPGFFVQNTLTHLSIYLINFLKNCVMIVQRVVYDSKTAILVTNWFFIGFLPLIQLKFNWFFWVVSAMIINIAMLKLTSHGILHYLCSADLSKSFSQLIISIFVFSQ